MPRKATLQSADVKIAIDMIADFCNRNNICILKLSQAAQVSQSALSRFMDGQRKAVTPTARKCITYVKNQEFRHKQHSMLDGTNGADGRLIESAAKALWDGDPRTEKLVASIIGALKPIVGIMLATAKGQEEKESL